ncbi:MAG TPA: rhodanese-like domain-containing protein [Bryobacteraceae bacterium]|jgi:thiosulfate/3-mercaptopyruvate sulfurtransferase|nr:rhodanese-like domain-containing protein [Bryobacteraceae bacterium]
MANYKYPEVLVSTDWVLAHLNDPNVRLVEVDVENNAYELGHIPGAIAWSWKRDLSGQTRRDILSREQFGQLLSNSGIATHTTVVLYGDNNNWFAAWAFWQFKIYGHKDVRLLNGGRKKWLIEGRELTLDVPAHSPMEYQPQALDNSIRAFLPDVQNAVQGGAAEQVDVRSPQEFTGEILAPPGLPETAILEAHAS